MATLLARPGSGRSGRQRLLQRTTANTKKNNIDHPSPVEDSRDGISQVDVDQLAEVFLRNSSDALEILARTSPSTDSDSDDEEETNDNNGHPEPGSTSRHRLSGEESMTSKRITHEVRPGEVGPMVDYHTAGDSVPSSLAFNNTAPFSIGGQRAGTGGLAVDGYRR